MKPVRYILIILAAAMTLALSACTQQKAEPTPEAVFQPTRSVATVAVPTRVATCSNQMSYVRDDTYDDGTVVAPGTIFLKEWEVINNGDCNWDERYRLFFISGNQMGAPDFVSIPHIPVGSKGKISVELTAPEEPGEYRSEWKLFDSSNRFFGESLIANITVR